MRKLSMAFPLVFAACSSSPTNGDGGDDAGSESSIPINEGGACSTDKSPKDDKCTIDEAYGVFVSDSLGSAMGDGSRTKPLKTIQAGIDLAKSTKKNVYVCAEQYKEQLSLAEGVAIYGYFDCAMGWSVVAKRAIVNPDDKVPVVKANMIQKGTRIEALDVRAPSTLSFSVPTSSIAMLFVSSPGLLLADMHVVAGDAPGGKDGTDAMLLVEANTKDGTNGYGGYQCNPQLFACQAGPYAPGGKNTCTGKANINPGPGGDGGKPSRWNYNSGWGMTASPGNGAPQPGNNDTTQGGIISGAAPKNGADGMNGASGKNGADVGVFDPILLYTPMDGTAGTDGAAGQGAGGGAGADVNPGNLNPANGSQFWGHIGGSGGAGGCPGLAGTPGTGGLASVAILAFDSGFQINASLVETGAAGKAGKAGLSSPAFIGGKAGTAIGNAQAGGAGGTGGMAGACGNGGAGPSIGIAYHGPMPVVGTTTTIMPGMGGAGVMARSPDGLAPIPATPNGKTAATYGF